MMKNGFGLVRVINLNRQSYLPVLALQKWFEQRHLTVEEADPVLILVEHDPVYTAGFREKINDKERTRLLDSGAEFIKSDRGGLTTFHGPGQLVAYPIFHLERLRPRLTLRKYVSLLEDTAIHTCRMLGVPARINNESISHTGAWVNDRKICAVGVHCRRYVTTHGLALNNTVNLKWYENIVPCGIQDKGVTSIREELGVELPMDTLKSQFLQSFQITFNCALASYDQYSLSQILETLPTQSSSVIRQ